MKKNYIFLFLFSANITIPIISSQQNISTKKETSTQATMPDNDIKILSKAELKAQLAENVKQQAIAAAAIAQQQVIEAADKIKNSLKENAAAIAQTAKDKAKENAAAMAQKAKDKASSYLNGLFK